MAFAIGWKAATHDTFGDCLVTAHPTDPTLAVVLLESLGELGRSYVVDKGDLSPR